MVDEYYLGVDGGGTKTAAVLVDEQGREIARAVSGPSNYHSVGLTTAQASLQEAISRALASAGLTAADVTAAGVGMAGMGRPDDWKVAQDLLSRVAGFRRLVITHDAEAALVGGVGRRYGAVLIAGTGAMAYGVNAHGQVRRADGWGYLLGDEGSAHWIGLQGLRAVVRAHDGRGPATALVPLLLSHLGLPDTPSLVPLVYGGGLGGPHPGLREPRLAGLAPLVSQVAHGGDAVAQAILREAGQRLGHTLSTVVQALHMAGEVFEVVLLGGVLEARDAVRDTVVAILTQVAPHAAVIEPRHDPAVGAAMLAQWAEEWRWEDRE